MYNITNSTDPVNILVSLSQNVPILFPMLLLFEFFFIAIAGATFGSKKNNFTNIPQWFSIAGLTTSTSAMILFLIDGLIPLSVVVVTVIATCLSVFWFFMSEGE